MTAIDRRSVPAKEPEATLAQPASLRLVLAAQEQARCAIAADLHDGLAQTLMALRLHLDAFCAARRAGLEERAQQELEKVVQRTRKAVLEARDLVHRLRGSEVAERGLVPALERLLEGQKERAGWRRADLIEDLSPKRLDPTVEELVYRVVEAALAAIRRQGEVEEACVALRFEESPDGPRLRLEIRMGGGAALEDARQGHGFSGFDVARRLVALAGGLLEAPPDPEAPWVRLVLPAVAISAEESGEETR